MLKSKAQNVELLIPLVSLKRETTIDIPTWDVYGMHSLNRRLSNKKEDNTK